MAQSITLTTEGLLLNWLKDIGEHVNQGDIIAEVEADKATMEIEAPASGTLIAINAEIGEELQEGAVIGQIGEAGEAVLPNSVAPQQVAPPSPKPQVSSTNGAAAMTTPDGRIKISPLARKIAAEKGIDISQVVGTGSGGRIIKKDVENYAPPLQQRVAIAPKQTYGTLPQASDEVELIDISRMRRAIADSTILSKQMTPHFYVTVEIDVAELLKVRKALNAELKAEGIKISVNDMIVKATALTLRQFPNLNSHYYGDKIVRYKRINIGISVALPNNGLLNVVSHDADRHALSVMAVNHSEMFSRAREGKVNSSDLQGATFTVSNLGPYNVESFSAIINPPQAGIIAVSSARKVPIVTEEGALSVGHRMKTTVSVDHRVSDGAEGAEFMREFRSLIENPMRLLV